MPFDIDPINRSSVDTGTYAAIQKSVAYIKAYKSKPQVAQKITK